ncbi:MAG: hypothetical protein ACRC6I_01855 [Paracoccaceae bacterium]
MTKALTYPFRNGVQLSWAEVVLLGGVVSGMVQGHVWLIVPYVVGMVGSMVWREAKGWGPNGGMEWRGEE